MLCVLQQYSPVFYAGTKSQDIPSEVRSHSCTIKPELSILKSHAGFFSGMTKRKIHLTLKKRITILLIISHIYYWKVHASI